MHVRAGARVASLLSTSTRTRLVQEARIVCKRRGSRRCCLRVPACIWCNDHAHHLHACRELGESRSREITLMRTDTHANRTYVQASSVREDLLQYQVQSEQSTATALYVCEFVTLTPQFDSAKSRLSDLPDKPWSQGFNPSPPRCMP